MDWVVEQTIHNKSPSNRMHTVDSQNFLLVCKPLRRYFQFTYATFLSAVRGRKMTLSGVWKCWEHTLESRSWCTQEWGLGTIEYGHCLHLMVCVRWMFALSSPSLDVQMYSVRDKAMWKNLSKMKRKQQPILIVSQQGWLEAIEHFQINLKELDRHSCLMSSNVGFLLSDTTCFVYVGMKNCVYLSWL